MITVILLWFVMKSVKADIFSILELIELIQEKYDIVDFIYQYINQEKVKSLLGTINVIGIEGKVSLEKIYFQENIKNIQFITEFVNQINWFSIIKENPKSEKQVLQLIIDQYVGYFQKKEEIYNTTLFVEEVINKYKNIAYVTVREQISTLNISSARKNQLLLPEYIKMLVEIIDWYTYIKTTDCQSQQMILVKQNILIIHKLIPLNEVALIKHDVEMSLRLMSQITYNTFEIICQILNYFGDSHLVNFIDSFKIKTFESFHFPPFETNSAAVSTLPIIEDHIITPHVKYRFYLNATLTTIKDIFSSYGITVTFEDGKTKINFYFWIFGKVNIPVN